MAPGRDRGRTPHDWLTLTGGAIGQGLPVATGAAVACPDRSVLALDSDGSAMYTISALWTHAREQLDITTVIFSNRRYAILDLELQRVGRWRAVTRPAACSTCPGPTWTSPPWPAGWVYPRPGPPRRGVRRRVAARAG